MLGPLWLGEQTVEPVNCHTEESPNSHLRVRLVSNCARICLIGGDVHTNSVEGIRPLLKRSIVGSYHKVSTKHLDSYLDELEWRFNNRENPYLFRDTLRKLIESDNLQYKELTA